MRYIAFLRAINVGGHNVKMDALLKLFQALEFSNVETFIASGNVIFETRVADAPAVERQIEQHLHATLGYKVPTILRTPSQLARIASYQPFPPDLLSVEGSSLYIAFLQATPDPSLEQRLAALRTPVDEFHLHGREIYWFCLTRLSESLVSGPQFEKTIGAPSTLRNSTTVQKLAAKYPARE